MKKIAALIICGLLLCSIVFAQAPNLKIGYINSATLLNAMPEKAKADSDLAAYAKSFQDEVDMMTKEYQNDVQQFQAGQNKMDDAIKEVKGKEIQDLQNRIESIQQSAQEKLQQKKSDLWSPIIEKLTKAINSIGKEKNYDYIFDAANGGLVYEKEEYDITNLVKARYGAK